MSGLTKCWVLTIDGAGVQVAELVSSAAILSEPATFGRVEQDSRSFARFMLRIYEISSGICLLYIPKEGKNTLLNDKKS